MEGEFWLKREGYAENCPLLVMREVLFARIVNLAKEKGGRGTIQNKKLRKINVLLERYGHFHSQSQSK